MGKFPKKVEGWKVNSMDIDDDEVFDTEQEAKDSVEVEEVVRWECVDCGDKHEDRDDAYHCCE